MKFKESDLKDIQKNISKYCLINIKAFFIISYMYISVVNLISTTANSEATMDEEGDSHFDITSLPQHQQLNVSRINDPVLWNCRETSLTRNYYKILYIMLFTASGTATVVFFSVKALNFCGDRPLNRLWEVAVAQHLKETHTIDNDSEGRYSEEKTKEIIECYQSIFKMKLSEIKDKLTGSYIKLRTFAPILSTFYLVVGWWLLLLSYDLHPVSCLSGPNEDTISYDKNVVKIRHSPGWLGFQTAAVIIGSIFIAAVLMNGLFFYAINGLIVDEMKTVIKGMYDKLQPVNEELETTIIN